MGRWVRGSIVSSEPVSLRRSAALISNFAAADTGASPEIAAYVRRASRAFNELVQFHRELKLAHKITRPAADDGGSRIKEQRSTGEIIADNDWVIGADGEQSRRRKEHFTSAKEERGLESRSLERRNEEMMAVDKKPEVKEEKKNKKDKERNQAAEFVDEVRRNKKEMKRSQEPENRKKDKEDRKRNRYLEVEEEDKGISVRKNKEVRSKEEGSEKKNKKDNERNQAAEFVDEVRINKKEMKMSQEPGNRKKDKEDRKWNRYLEVEEEEQGISLRKNKELRSKEERYERGKRRKTS